MSCTVFLFRIKYLTEANSSDYFYFKALNNMYMNIKLHLAKHKFML